VLSTAPSISGFVSTL